MKTKELDVCFGRPCDVIAEQRPRSGVENMAVDAVLLEEGLQSDHCVVRVYTWCEPTVSLGHFQMNPDIVSPFPQLPTVRRLSGGGAILHDQEVTYSCVIPASHPLHSEPGALYGRMHRAIIELLRECGVSSRMRSDQAEFRQNGPPAEDRQLPADAFLCFLRSDSNDIVCDRRAPGLESHTGVCKIVGSAQRRRRGTILQHGSILLQASRCCPDVPGIFEMFPKFAIEDFVARLPQRLADQLGSVQRLRDPVSLTCPSPGQTSDR